MATGRHTRTGRYQALCGHTVTPIPMVEPDGRPCPSCTAHAMSPGDSSRARGPGRHRWLGRRRPGLLPRLLARIRPHDLDRSALATPQADRSSTDRGGTGVDPDLLRSHRIPPHPGGVVITEADTIHAYPELAQLATIRDAGGRFTPSPTTTGSSTGSLSTKPAPNQPSTPPPHCSNPRPRPTRHPERSREIAIIRGAASSGRKPQMKCGSRRSRD